MKYGRRARHVGDQAERLRHDLVALTTNLKTQKNCKNRLSQHCHKQISYGHAHQPEVRNYLERVIRTHCSDHQNIPNCTNDC